MLSRRMKIVGLIAFLKGSSDPKVGMPGCANYNHHHGGCLFGVCLVEQGKRCGYFEQAVLPTATDVGLTDRLYSAYEKQCKVPGVLTRAQMRICPDCGIGLKPQQRYCDKCARKRRQDAGRALRRKQRKVVRSDVFSPTG